MRILLVEDDRELGETIAKYLSREGYEVVHLFDTLSAREILEREQFDLLLLDVKLPKESGFSFMEREEISIPTIYITSLNSIDDIERGFRSGAIEYIKKPFSLKELHLRIQAALKFHRGGEIQKKIVIDGNHTFLPDQGALIRDGQKIYLSPKREELLKLLLKERGRVVPNGELLEVAGSMSALRTYIKELRRLLPPGSIETVKEVGYRFVPRD
ncbi:MAG: response regulator transcription factor [Epsilonproteobacteria bacterium]|nr:two-component system response regulator [Campylobacterota bacterium]NPA57394.1 response regulator transcription factor [Campylobacterota bacterium]